MRQILIVLRLVMPLARSFSRTLKFSCGRWQRVSVEGTGTPSIPDFTSKVRFLSMENIVEQHHKSSVHGDWIPLSLCMDFQERWLHYGNLSRRSAPCWLSMGAACRRVQAIVVSFYRIRECHAGCCAKPFVSPPAIGCNPYDNDAPRCACGIGTSQRRVGLQVSSMSLEF